MNDTREFYRLSISYQWDYESIRFYFSDPKLARQSIFELAQLHMPKDFPRPNDTMMFLLHQQFEVMPSNWIQGWSWDPDDEMIGSQFRLRVNLFAEQMRTS